jgi:hypothetical protein
MSTLQVHRAILPAASGSTRRASPLGPGAIAASILVLALAGCAGAPSPKFSLRLPALTASHPVSVSDRLTYAVALLGRGQAQDASNQLGAVLAVDPHQPLARLLLSEIEQDPKIILGRRSHPYRVRPGETMTLLAHRFLGDPHLFYALARFNDIAVPDEPLTGRVIMVPGAGAPASPKHAPRRPPAATVVRQGQSPVPAAQKPSVVQAWRLNL